MSSSNDALCALIAIIYGAVGSPTGILPILTHFALHQGRLWAFDGRIAIDAPVPRGTLPPHLSCTVPAKRFADAIDACRSKGDAVPKVEVKEGMMTVSMKGLHIRIPAGDVTQFPFRVQTTGREHACPGLLSVLRTLEPFMGNDASRPWSSGIYFQDKFAAVTNNVVIALHALPWTAPTPYILSSFAVKELLRIGRAPVACTTALGSVEFRLEGAEGVVFQARLIDAQWPKSPISVVQELSAGAALVPLNEEVSQAVELITPFCADAQAPVVEFKEDRIQTIDADMQAVVQGFPGLGECKFRVEPLKDVLRIATHIDFRKFPRVPWYRATTEGKAKPRVDVRGVIVGIS